MNAIRILLLAMIFVGQSAFGAAGDNYIINKNNGKAINFITTTGGGTQTQAASVDGNQAWVVGATGSTQTHTINGSFKQLLSNGNTLPGSGVTASGMYFANNCGGCVSPQMIGLASGNGQSIYISAWTGNDTSTSPLMQFDASTNTFGAISTRPVLWITTGGGQGGNGTLLGEVKASGQWTWGVSTANANLSHQMYGLLNLSGLTTGNYSLGASNSTAVDTDHLAYHFVNTLATGGTVGKHFQYAANKNGSGIHGWGTDASGNMIFGKGTAASGLIDQLTYGSADTSGAWTLGPPTSTNINLSVNGIIDVANTSQATKQGVGAYLYKNSSNANTALSGVGLNFESGSAGVRVINGSVGNDGTWTIGPTSGGASLTHTIASGSVTTLQIFSPQNTSGLTGIQFRRGGGSIWNLQHDIATDQFRINQPSNGDVAVVTTAGAWTFGVTSGTQVHNLNGSLLQNGSSSTLYTEENSAINVTASSGTFAVNMRFNAYFALLHVMCTDHGSGTNETSKYFSILRAGSGANTSTVLSTNNVGAGHTFVLSTIASGSATLTNTQAAAADCYWTVWTNTGA